MIFQKELIKSLAAHGTNTAIEYEEKSISYSVLSDMAEKLTRFLLKKNLEKGTVVGILLQDRLDLISTMIGVVNAGCVFVPIDDNLPAKRLLSIVNDLNLHYLISWKDAPGNTVLEQVTGLEISLLENVFHDAADTVATAITYPQFEEEDSLYIYFTSGSTGRPKGIIGKNSSLLQFVQWEIKTFDVNSTTRVSQLISPYFDAFLRDVFVPLLAGGTICIPAPGMDFYAPEKMISWIDDKCVNLIHCVPSLFRIINNPALFSGRFKHLQYILLSGEKINPAELVGWYNIFGPRIQLVNLYGPTETTMIRSWYVIEPSDAHKERIPIGSPIDGTELLIARKDLTPCNPLVAGDLYIISDYMTKGYLNAPELTHEKFVRINRGAAGDVIAFKTGDIARRLPDGKIDLLGREDRQVKVRGVRIELDEVESVLLQSEFVNRAVVLKHAEENGNESIVAFIIKQKGFPEAHLWENVVRRHLEANLPAYMIPAVITAVEDYPLLSNGKTDYKELLNSLTTQPVVAPVNETENKILGIWKEILGDKPISTTTKFQHAGGNSLSIMRLIGKIYKEFNVRISLSELIHNSTISQQAAFIRHTDKDSLMTISPAAVKLSYNLSSAQERIYYSYSLHKTSTAYNMPMAWKLKKKVRKEEIEAVLQQLINRHESLRTAFRFEDGKFKQVVETHLDFKVEEIRQDQYKTVRDAIAEFVKPFDLGNTPLIRCRIGTCKNDERILLVDLHHIICDGMSQLLLMSEFLDLYQGVPLKPMFIQYKDYAEWEYGFKSTVEYISQREFWLKAFDGDIPRTDLPVNNTRLQGQVVGGGNVFFEIERSAMAPLIILQKEEEISTFSCLFALFSIFLARITGQDDLVTGINTSGRFQDGLENVIGMFAKTLPIRYQVDMDLSFRKYAASIHKYLVEANSKQIFDLSDIMAELNKRSAEPVKRLFDVMFVMQNFGQIRTGKDDNDFSLIAIEDTTAKYPLSLFVQEGIAAFEFRMEYDAAYFDKADIELLTAQFISLVKLITVHPDETLLTCMGKSTPLSQYIDNSITFNL